MQRIDVVIGAALLLAVGVTAIGVMGYEDTREGGLWRVVWSTEAVALDLPSTTTDPGATTARSTFDLDLRNLTEVEVVVTVEGGGPRATDATVSVRLEPPNGTAVEMDGTLPAGPGGAATIRFLVPLQDLPADGVVAARDAAAAAAAGGLNATAGVGTWTVSVALPAGAPGPLAAGYTITLDGTATVAVAAVSADLPEVRR